MGKMPLAIAGHFFSKEHFQVVLVSFTKSGSCDTLSFLSMLQIFPVPVKSHCY